MPLSAKPTIEVCLSPTLYDQHEPAGKTIVVVDIFRATTTISAALAYGVKEVLPVPEVSDLEAYHHKEGYICAAENNGQLVSPYDYGNSPYHYQGEEVQGKTLVLRSTNGTRMIKLAAETGAKVYTGAFTHLQALLQQLSKEAQSVIVLCAGWHNRVNLEDSLFAGAVVEGLRGKFEIGDDSSLAAGSLYRQHRQDLLEACKQASHYHRLAEMGVKRDIEFALVSDQFDGNPVFDSGVLTL